jgi:hypothetical protein
MDSALRPMSASQVLDRTFYLYRTNFALFAGIAMIAPAFTLVAGLLQVWWLGLPATPDPTKMDPDMIRLMFQDLLTRGAIGMTVGMAAYVVGYSIASGATVYAVSMLHLGKSTTIQEAYSRIKPLFGRILALVVRIFAVAAGPLILAYAVLFGLMIFVLGKVKGGPDAGAIIGAGFGFLVGFFSLLGGLVWMVYAFCRYGLAVPACAIENLPVKFSMIRSKFLARGSMGRIFCVYLLTGLIALAFKSVLQTPAYVGTGMFSRHGMHLNAGWLAWMYAAEFIGTMVAGPISTIAMALVYYDQRVRKEAFDLQLMMDSLQPAVSTAASSS